MYENKENTSSSRNNSSCDENEYGEVPNVEVLCREEETCYDKASNFLDCSIDDIFVISISIHLDYDYSQGE